jgi:hypothetical protein
VNPHDVYDGRGRFEKYYDEIRRQVVRAEPVRDKQVNQKEGDYVVHNVPYVVPHRRRQDHVEHVVHEIVNHVHVRSLVIRVPVFHTQGVHTSGDQARVEHGTRQSVWNVASEPKHIAEPSVFNLLKDGVQATESCERVHVKKNQCNF